jgi:protein-tyrosine phosphatase
VADFDRAELALKLPACVDALNALLTAGDTVYLHCTAGVNRSPTVAVAYLHWSLGRPLDEALAHVRDCRDCVPDGEAVRLASRRRDKTIF